jgi:hypothetical protein
MYIFKVDAREQIEEEEEGDWRRSGEEEGSD